MVENLRQRLTQVSIYSFPRQATATMAQRTVEAAMATFGVLHSELTPLTKLGTWNQIRTFATCQVSTVSTALWCVAFASNFTIPTNPIYEGAAIRSIGYKAPSYYILWVICFSFLRFFDKLIKVILNVVSLYIHDSLNSCIIEFSIEISVHQTEWTCVRTFTCNTYTICFVIFILMTINCINNLYVEVPNI